MENEEKVPQMEVGSAFIKRKRRVPKVFFVVGIFVLLIGGGCFGVFYYNSNKVGVDANGKIDIYSLKGAKKVLDASDLKYERKEEVSSETQYVHGDPGSKEEILLWLKKGIETSQTAVVYGTAKNIKIVKIKDHVYFSRMERKYDGAGSGIQKKRKYDYPVEWWIATFDIEVIDDMGTLGGRDLVRVVMASRYATGDTGGDREYAIRSPEGMKEMLMILQANPTGVFELRKQAVGEEKKIDEEGFSSYGNIWEIKRKEYCTSEFADYYLDARYNCDGEKYQYDSSSDYCTIYLDEIRVQEE